MAQIPDLITQTPPLAHVLVDRGDLLLGGRHSYTQIKNPPYKVDNISAETVTTIRGTTILAYGFSDVFAIAMSSDPTQVEIEGKIIEGGIERAVSTQTNSNSSMFYLIPTLYRGMKNRLAVILGKGKSRFGTAENLTTGSSFDTGLTGLVAEFFLLDSFSLIPWVSWNYLLFDILPLKIETKIGDPDYGIEGIFHFGGFRISAGMVNHAFDTVSKLNGNQESEPSDSNTKSSEKNYNISFAIVF